LRLRRTSPVTVAAVIPTIGRVTLSRAVESVLGQSFPVCEVVIANDSADQHTVLGSVGTTDVPLIEVFTGGSRGVSDARNRGVAAASGSHIAYLDDDDIWLPHHIMTAVKALTGPVALDVYSCSAIRCRSDAAVMVPKVRYKGRGTLIDFLYGRFSFAGRDRSLPATTWVFRRELAVQHTMDSSLRMHEDIWWLLQLAHLRYRIWQADQPGTLYFENAARTIGRVSLEVELDWAARLEGLKRGAGTRYLVNIAGRRHARRGEQRAWHELMFVVERDWTSSLETAIIRKVERLVLEVAATVSK